MTLVVKLRGGGDCPYSSRPLTGAHALLGLSPATLAPYETSRPVCAAADAPPRQTLLCRGPFRSCSVEPLAAASGTA